MDKKTIALMITSYGPIDSQAYRNHVGTFTKWGQDFNLAIFHIGDVQQHEALNQMLVEAKKKVDPDYYFFAEHDNLYEADTLNRLVEDDKDIVTGYYCFRHWPFYPIPLEKLDVEKDTLTRFEYVPGGNEHALLKCVVGCFGCCLVKKEVFGHLPEKPFKYQFVDKFGTTLLPDVLFFDDCINKGFEVFVDGEVTAAHLGERVKVTPQNWRLLHDMYSLIYPEKVDLTEEAKKIVQDSYMEWITTVRERLSVEHS
jgi:hypothetical protein